MKHLLRKLHRGGSREDHIDSASASSSSSSSNFTEWFSSLVRHASSKARPETPAKAARQRSDDLARASAARPSLPGPASARGRLERCSSNLEQQQQHDGGTTTSQALSKQPSSSSEYQSLEEEYQMQLAIALSVSNDGAEPDIEVAKKISLGVRHSAAGAAGGTQAELVAYRYWADNVVNYDEPIVDGFYDVYGVVYDPGVPEKLPSLVDLQGEPVSSSVSSEVVLVNRLLDPELAKLEQWATVLLADSRARGESTTDLARRIALLVSEQMGGPVASYTDMLALWRSSSWELRSALKSNVIPLGRLRVGLARHRALLFKVLADSAGLPCRLVKGKQYTGADEGAVSIVRDADNREFIIDLMADPGALIPPSDVPASAAPPTGQAAKDKTLAPDHRHLSEPGDLQGALPSPTERRLSSHMRSPSWTEGIGSRGLQRRGAREASQYVIDAAKEDPGLAQKLHDVLLESGVVAPPGLLSELGPQQQQQLSRSKPARAAAGREKTKPPLAVPRALHQAAAAAAAALADEKLPRLHSVEGLGDRRPLEPPPAAAVVASVSPAVSAATAALALNAVQDKFPADKIVHSPVAASAITAAVVASSMVVAAAKIESANPDLDLEVPISAAATATAAVVAATSAAVVLKSDSDSGKSDHNKGGGSNREDTASQSGSGGGRRTTGGSDYEAEESPGSSRSRTDSVLQDVAEYEIPWDELVVGDRIGLGSYGEVYRGEWRGTAVAIKRFLDQDISGDALEEFITEVRLMKRMRHPNVVLFMGAVTRPPHLSIVTEFLPRGSLFKLLHRPSTTQLDERRRMRMALDVAKGMNYLHTSNPIIVHRDLKSPNLLVDKNWVVKVCDFGLSRMKHNTFLSSKSQAGTPEWMAPEVLRNEPSDEKADVYSFGIILWELMTLQQPWQGLNPMQVVGAVGFQHRRLDIPESVDANIARVIQECWHSEPSLRPSFAEIMTTLRPLQQRSNSARQLSSPRDAAG